MTASIDLSATHRRVRVWFGTHPIADHVADADRAAQYEQAMRRRFASLRVTSEPIPVESARGGVATAERTR
jgi:hypothetical protein